VERREHSDHTGKLSPISAVSSGLVLLTAGLWRLANAVAARQAGTVSDVLRLAIPAAHVATEKLLAAASSGAEESGKLTGGDLAAGDSQAAAEGVSNDALAERSPSRVAWACRPGPDLFRGLRAAVDAARAAGRQTLIIAPSERLVASVLRALSEPEDAESCQRRPPPADLAGILAGIESDGRGRDRDPGLAPPGQGDWSGRAPELAADCREAGPVIGRLVAGDGPEARLEAYWAAASGALDVLVGTRAAAFAPLARPGLLVLLNDGDPALREPRAPYAHARTVLTVRAAQERTDLLVAGMTRSVQAQALVESGWLAALSPSRSQVRAATPVVNAPTVEDLAREGTTALTRFPEAAFRLVRRGLSLGPVLIQVPSAAHEVFGLIRTAEEIARAFPASRLARSGEDVGIVERVGPEPVLVVATPGAEPSAVNGYAAAILLDARAWAGRPELDAAVDALRIWMGGAGLVRPRGEVLLLGSDGGPAAQALVRWDPVGLAERELAERRELGLPPATKAVVLTEAPGKRSSRSSGTSAVAVLDSAGGAGAGAVAGFVAALGLPAEVRVRTIADKTVLLIPAPQAKEVIGRIRQVVREKSATGQSLGVRVRVDGELD
jgi:primosomal protein N' (replication factor Y)